MQPNSSQNPNPNNQNPNPNNRHNQHHCHFHQHCTHHPPYPHVHIPVFFCSHHHHHHQQLHHLHLHTTQIPCNFFRPSSSFPSPPLPLSEPSINQTNQGPEISHPTTSDLRSLPQEQEVNNRLEENDEEEEDIFVLTDEWVEFFAKSEARRQLAKQNKKKGRK